MSSSSPGSASESKNTAAQLGQKTSKSTFLIAVKVLYHEPVWRALEVAGFDKVDHRHLRYVEAVRKVTVGPCERHFVRLAATYPNLRTIEIDVDFGARILVELNRVGFADISATAEYSGRYWGGMRVSRDGDYHTPDHAPAIRLLDDLCKAWDTRIFTSVMTVDGSDSLIWPVDLPSVSISEILLSADDPCISLGVLDSLRSTDKVHSAIVKLPTRLDAQKAFGDLLGAMERKGIHRIGLACPVDFASLAIALTALYQGGPLMSALGAFRTVSIMFKASRSSDTLQDGYRLEDFLAGSWSETVWLDTDKSRYPAVVEVVIDAQDMGSYEPFFDSNLQHRILGLIEIAAAALLAIGGPLAEYRVRIIPNKNVVTRALVGASEHDRYRYGRYATTADHRSDPFSEPYKLDALVELYGVILRREVAKLVRKGTVARQPAWARLFRE